MLFSDESQHSDDDVFESIIIEQLQLEVRERNLWNDH